MCTTFFKMRIVALIGLTFAITFTGDVISDSSLQSCDSRLASIAVTPPSRGGPANFWENYEQALELAMSTGIDLPGELAFYWSSFERRSLLGNISYQDENTIRLIEMLKHRNLPVVITISPFETLNSRIPSDLTKYPYDHEKTMGRLKRFIDWIYQQTEGVQAVSIVFGNEFDLHVAFESAAGNNRWSELDGMVEQTRQYVKSLERWKDIPFALEATYAGLTDVSTRLELQKLNRHSDIIGVSYYPLAENSVQDPSILDQHFKDLVALYPDKLIDFYQYGYPSSEVIDGSLEKQRQFIESSFRLWDQYCQQIRMITFTWLYDIGQVHIENESASVLGELKPDQAFLAFLGSLGLHGQSLGERKPAFTELEKQLKLRQW